MKRNELMTGDWVSYHGIINKVAPADFCQKKWLEGIKPIPLTPEILEKIGFVANKHVYPYPYYEYIDKENEIKIGFAFPQGNKTSYKEPWIYIDTKYVYIEHLPCVFVHQLQHALRICEIEIEIVL